MRGGGANPSGGEVVAEMESGGTEVRVLGFGREEEAEP